MQIADFIANGMLDAWETMIGASPKLRLRAGPPPANLAAASQGAIIAVMDLPANWMNDAANRQKTKNGAWEDLAADNQGIIAHYEIVANDGVTRCEQGTVTADGGGGDMTVDNTNVNVGQKITVTGFTRTMPNNA